MHGTAPGAPRRAGGAGSPAARRGRRARWRACAGGAQQAAGRTRHRRRAGRRHPLSDLQRDEGSEGQAAHIVSGPHERGDLVDRRLEAVPVRGNEVGSEHLLSCERVDLRLPGAGPGTDPVQEDERQATGSDSVIQMLPSPHRASRASSPGVGQARAEELEPLAVELGDRPFDLGGSEHVPPRAHLVVDLPRALRPVDLRVVRLRRAPPSSRPRPTGDRRDPRPPAARRPAAASRTCSGGSAGRSPRSTCPCPRSGRSTARGSGRCRTPRPSGATSSRTRGRLRERPTRAGTGRDGAAAAPDGC